MAKKPFIKKNKNFDEPRINEELKNLETVRLVYKEHSNSQSDNDFVEVCSIRKAFDYSKEYGLDLIEINSHAIPPVVRLYDYSKYLFEMKKSNKEKKKKTSTCKEIQLTTNISLHDLEIKVSKAKEFIADGNKVKVVLKMRGRELGRREQSKSCFYTFEKMMNEVAVLEAQPKDEGNKVIMIFKKR